MPAQAVYDEKLKSGKSGQYIHKDNILQICVIHAGSYAYE